MKNSSFFRVGLLFMVILSLTSCATWARVDNPQMIGPEGRYYITLPSCWIHAAFISDGICISKDGPLLNWVQIMHFKKDQGFPLTQVILGDDTLISEAAEYYLAELKETYRMGTVNHVNTEPAEVDGKSAFKIHLEIIDDKGLAFDVLAYGVMDAQYFYHISYKAPRLLYFEKELAAFEKMVGTFHAQPGL